MEKGTTLRDILQIGYSPDILESCCPDTGIPLWGTIRSAFLRLIMGDLLYSVPIDTGDGVPGAGSKLRQLFVISRAFTHNALRLNVGDQQYPIILMATGARLFEREGRYFNALSDYFVSVALDRISVVEDLFNSNWPFPRHHHKVLLQTPLRVEGVLKRLLRRNSFRQGSARVLIELVSQRAKNIIWRDIGDDRQQVIERLCCNGAASLLPRYWKYHSDIQDDGRPLAN